MNHNGKFLVAGLVLGLSVGVLCGRHVLPVKRDTTQPRQHDKLRLHAKVTAYCPCEQCCGKYADGRTSTGKDAWRTRGVAVDPKRIPYGSKVTIPGAGTFIADDTGGAMRNAKMIHIDLRFNNHVEALAWGVQHMEVVVR